MALSLQAVVTQNGRGCLKVPPRRGTCGNPGRPRSQDATSCWRRFSARSSFALRRGTVRDARLPPRRDQPTAAKGPQDSPDARGCLVKPVSPWEDFGAGALDSQLASLPLQPWAVLRRSARFQEGVARTDAGADLAALPWRVGPARTLAHPSNRLSTPPGPRPRWPSLRPFVTGLRRAGAIARAREISGTLDRTPGRREIGLGGRSDGHTDLSP